VVRAGGAQERDVCGGSGGTGGKARSGI